MKAKASSRNHRAGANPSFVSTDELVERFSVNPQTIRRDLNELADDNKIRRNR